MWSTSVNPSNYISESHDSPDLHLIIRSHSPTFKFFTQVNFPTTCLTRQKVYPPIFALTRCNLNTIEQDRSSLDLRSKPQMLQHQF